VRRGPFFSKYEPSHIYRRDPEAAAESRRQSHPSGLPKDK